DGPDIWWEGLPVCRGWAHLSDRNGSTVVLTITRSARTPRTWATACFTAETSWLNRSRWTVLRRTGRKTAHGAAVPVGVWDVERLGRSPASCRWVTRRAHDDAANRTPERPTPAPPARLREDGALRVGAPVTLDVTLRPGNRGRGDLRAVVGRGRGNGGRLRG